MHCGTLCRLELLLLSVYFLHCALRMSLWYDFYISLTSGGWGRWLFWFSEPTETHYLVTFSMCQLARQYFQRLQTCPYPTRGVVPHTQPSILITSAREDCKDWPCALWRQRGFCHQRVVEPLIELLARERTRAVKKKGGMKNNKPTAPMQR